jgi:hypothetical protein
VKVIIAAMRRRSSPPTSERLKPDGRLYVMVSSDSDLDLFGRLIGRVMASLRPQWIYRRRPC